MKHILSIILLTALIACNNKEKETKTILDSSGSINNVSVVITNELWGGSVGESIREVLAAPIFGLPQEEPTFTLGQIPPQVFSGFVARNRTVLQVEIGKPNGIQVLNDVYAKPQKMIIIKGDTKQTLKAEIVKYSDSIIHEFRTQELSERQRQMAKSPHNYTSIEKNLGLTLNFASAYRIAKETKDFFWIRKDITTGTTNLLLFQLPLSAIKPNDSIVNQIIKIRDSIGKTYIAGASDNTYMVTENAYSPYIQKTKIDGKPAYETKGIWDLKNGFMGGPFINYTIEDKANNRWIIAEGFAFAPSVEKRDYMLELESIIKSIKIK